MRFSLWLWPITTPRGAVACTRFLLALLLALPAVLLLSGCPSKTPVAQAPPAPPPPPAPTVSIDVAPATVQQGQPVTVTWKTENATDVTIAQIGAVQPNGSQSLTPTESATYHITAKGPGGVQEADARVTVVTAAAVEASPSSEDMAVSDANRLDVFFDLDEFSIRPDQVTTIQTDAQFLKDHPDMQIVVEGHCDELGSTEYNLALGDKRAIEVKAALEKAGVNSSRMRTVSYGKELPFCTQENEDCWKQNRRAHITPDVQR
jgi:peptidoglycan-associated lipoprotein